MKDAEFNRIKKLLRGYIDKWQAVMALGFFELNLEYDMNKHSEGFAATTDMSRWKYHSYDICFYMPTLAEMGDARLENVVIHELAHCLLAPISSNINYDDLGHAADTMEWNTELVARAVEWIYQAGADSVKLNHKEKSNEPRSRRTATHKHSDDTSSDK